MTEESADLLAAVGERLRDLRGTRSGRTVALATGMSRDTLRRAEAGESVDDVTYRRLEDYYGVRSGTMRRILAGKPEPAEPSTEGASTRSGQIPKWTLIDRMKKARAFAGLNQIEMADAMGVSKRSIANYETGGPLMPPIVVAWAAVTGVSLQWLLGNEVDSDGQAEARVYQLAASEVAEFMRQRVEELQSLE